MVGTVISVIGIVTLCFFCYLLGFSHGVSSGRSDALEEIYMEQNK